MVFVFDEGQGFNRLGLNNLTMKVMMVMLQEGHSFQRNQPEHRARSGVAAARTVLVSRDQQARELLLHPRSRRERCGAERGGGDELLLAADAGGAARPGGREGVQRRALRALKAAEWFININITNSLHQHKIRLLQSHITHTLA